MKILLSFFIVVWAFPMMATAQSVADEKLDVRIEEMTAAAKELLESVRGKPTFSEVLMDYEMEDHLVIDADSEHIKDWSYWPRERVGLSVDLMQAKHRALMHDLLWSLTSNKGYHKLINIMLLESHLQDISGTGFPRGVEDYKVAFFGEPSLTKPWSWRFEGHHISITVAVAPGTGVSVTPTFLGTDPAEVTIGPFAGLRVLRMEEDLARELVTSLSSNQKRKTILAGDADYNDKVGFSYKYDAPWDLHASPILVKKENWNDWKTLLKPDGISYKDLNDEQKAMLLAIIDEVLSDYREDVAAVYHAKIDVEDLHFAWIGGLEQYEPHYYRIQTGDFLFEYDNVQGNGNHVHQVLRSREGDFGEDLLKKHYEESPHHK